MLIRKKIVIISLFLFCLFMVRMRLNFLKLDVFIGLDNDVILILCCFVVFFIFGFVIFFFKKSIIKIMFGFFFWKNKRRESDWLYFVIIDGFGGINDEFGVEVFFFDDIFEDVFSCWVLINVI